MAELDAGEEEDITATFTSGPNTRIGTLPVTYDAQRKKMLWYYFMAASMKEREMVRSLSLHALAGPGALSHHCLSNSVMAASMKGKEKEKEMVCSPSLHALAGPYTLRTVYPQSPMPE